MTTVFRDIGAYRIVREIGHGGMATVFLAEDTREPRQVALKLVSMGADREAREVLDAERWGTKLQARLADACGLVPRVYEEGDQPPYYFIAMEYVHGENLSDVIARGPVDPAEAVRIACELSRFLQTAHGFKTAIDGREFWSLVHGDLKPRNVRVAENGDIKVLDFGIAKALSLSRKVTRNDFGSVPYLSPERLDSTEVDAHADLWALGVILYELLSGAAPFQAVDTRRLEQQIRIGYRCRPLPADCPRPLQAIVARLLAPCVEDRYPTAEAVRSDLELVREGRELPAETLGFPERLEEPPTRRTVTPVEEDPERTRRTAERADARDGDAAAPDSAAAAPAASAAIGAASPAPTQIPPAVQASPPAPVARRTRSRPIRAALLVAAIVLTLNEMAIGFQAGRVAARASTHDLDSIDDVWSQYDALSRHSYLRFGVVKLEETMAARAAALADQVIANYRSPDPTVRERQWLEARKNLQRALVLRPADRSLKASLRYCDGHLHRIDGEADLTRHQTAAARQQFTEAVSAFREAAELRRGWPDPFLGLARVFIYGLDDIDRAADALQQAQSLGYTPGDRETAQLADGYRTRGDRLRETARELADLPQEPDYLQRASDAYKQARDLYGRIPAYPGAALNLRRTTRALDDIDRRLARRTEQLSGSGAAWQ
jgi:tetratricopeptide (TPR) repeat protein/predicted Ser/Thr protein kinase